MDARPVALVTGGAQGIGLETARRLSATHRVALLDLRAEQLEAARRSCADDALAVVCDIAEQDQVTAAVAEVVERAGGIDVVFSNAGIGAGGALRHLDPEVLEAIIDVNLIGNWRVIHACLPSIIERRGYVLANASASALLPAMGIGHYAASKAGLEHLMNVLRVEVAHLGVDVGVTYFWFIATDMVEGAEREMGDLGQLRSAFPGPLAKVIPVSAAADAVVAGIRGRRRRVTAPGWVEPLYRVRGLLGRLAERDVVAVAPRVDAATAERVGRLGDFDAAFRPRSPAHQAAAHHVHHDLHDAPAP
jgi:NAD(P)-dependent dehydrogenase (short-subunit alcohol dehydrogenase family)